MSLCVLMILPSQKFLNTINVAIIEICVADALFTMHLWLSSSFM